MIVCLVRVVKTVVNSVGKSYDRKRYERKACGTIYSRNSLRFEDTEIKSNEIA